jgi:hypothetical protein
MENVLEPPISLMLRAIVLVNGREIFQKERDD